MKAKLSDAQFVALLWAVKHGEGKLVRRPGGFWTITEAPHHHSCDGYSVPIWHTGTQTVMALERLGLVKKSGDEPNLQYWLAPREITKEGRAVLDDTIDSGRRRRIMENRNLWSLHIDLTTESDWNARKRS